MQLQVGSPFDSGRGSTSRSPEMGNSSQDIFCPLNALARTPISREQLEQWLAGYPNRQAAWAIKRGFRVGFRIGYKGNREARQANNHGSAQLRPDIVREKLLKEVQMGRVAGPFQNIPMPNLIVSPIGLVKKAPLGNTDSFLTCHIPKPSPSMTGSQQRKHRSSTQVLMK